MGTIKQILVDMRKHNGLCVSPLFIYNEDGGVNFTELIDRIEAASKILESRSKRLAEIEKALDLFWVDDDYRPLTGDALADAVTEDPYEYGSLRDKLMDIQNIVFRNEVDHGND